MVRAARLLAIAIVIGWSVANVLFHVTSWNLSDMNAYWDAAMRLRSGAELFPPLANPSAADVYRYSPWFAWSWIPFTFLPKVIVQGAWSTILVGASFVAVRPLMRPDLTAFAVATLLGSFLIWGASVGNVQPLLIAVLVHGIHRRSGPLWVGVAASLKAVPLLYALIYVGRGEWRRAVLATAVSVLLAAPLLLYDLSNYPVGSGDAPSPLLAIAPALFLVVVGALCALTVWLAGRNSAFARLAASATVLAALPRITLLDLPQLVVGLQPEPRPRAAGRP